MSESLLLYVLVENDKKSNNYNYQKNKKITIQIFFFFSKLTYWNNIDDQVFRKSIVQVINTREKLQKFIFGIKVYF